MKKGNKAIFAIFDQRAQAESAVLTLKNSGFRSSDISLLMPQSEGVATGMGHEKSTKAPEAATIGTGAGVALGGALGWLVGIGTISINPLLAPFVAAGPIMSALAGAGVGGAVGGLSGAFVGAGFPEYEAKRYESLVREGGILLSVHVDDAEWTTKAREILQIAGANSISVSSEEGSPLRPEMDSGRDYSVRHMYP